MRVLLVEDDKDLALTIKDGLKSIYTVDVVYRGLEGQELSEYNEYDLIILDINLPDISGLTVCQTLRTHQKYIPILMLTANNEVQSKVTALDSGADDYLLKPFSFEELKARIRALLRRNTTRPSTNKLSVNDLVLDVTSRTVTRKGKEILLRRKEFSILEYLMRNVGRVLTRSMILEHVWESNIESEYSVVDVHIKHLRDKIDKKFNKKLIQTVYGLGYTIPDIP